MSLAGDTVVDDRSDEATPLDNPVPPPELRQGFFHAIVHDTAVSLSYYQRREVNLMRQKQWILRCIREIRVVQPSAASNQPTVI